MQEKLIKIKADKTEEVLALTEFDAETGKRRIVKHDGIQKG